MDDPVPAPPLKKPALDRQSGEGDDDGQLQYSSIIHPAGGPGDRRPSMRRTSTEGSRRSHRHHRRSTSSASFDPQMDINLPYRTLTEQANLDEYRTENPEGEIPGPAEPTGPGRYKLVTFQPNDPDNPKNWSKAYKWYCTMVVALTCFVVAFASSVITADIEGVKQSFDVSNEVALVSITVFVVGFGIGMFFLFLRLPERKVFQRSIASSGLTICL